MPRRLIIGVLIILILGIIGGSVVLVIRRLRGPNIATMPDSATTTPDSLSPATPGGQNVVDNPTGDDDNDGLPNAEEVKWQTDINNADTDNDGYQDGEEVQANHNPTIAAPGDILPAGFIPGQNLTPLDQAPLQADQFFADDIDLTGPKTNLTQAYHQQFKPEERTQATLIQFAESQPIITKLPTVKVEALKRTSADTPADLVSYLEVAGNLDKVANQDKLRVAFNELFDDQDPRAVAGVALTLRQHQAALKEAITPPAATQVQKFILSYTEVLAATLEQMTDYNQDPVKALAALRQLETIDRQYFPLLRDEMARLQQVNARAAELAPHVH